MGAFSIAADILDPPAWQPENRPEPQPHQIPPEMLGRPKGPKLWLLEAGRGAGKTEACARYYCKFMRQTPKARGRIIAPTFGDAVEACVRGPSGVLSMDPEAKWVPGADGGSKIVWPNGSEALVMGTPFKKDVDRLRATGNRHLDWWEEMAANTQLEEAWDQAAMGLRLGEQPHAIGSTTPRSIKAYRAIRKMSETSLTKATMFDNPHNPESFVEKMKARYEGTRLGRQELYGELLEDVVGALWTRHMIEDNRVDKADIPEMAVIVVAVDPAATSKDGADDTGIIVVGLGVDGYVYVLEDATCHLAPNKWGHRAVDRYTKWEADYIVGEVNNGGEMVEHVIATVDTSVPFKSVHASRGKQTRAQPVASLYGNYDEDDDNRMIREGYVRHVGGFPELEDQMCTWVPGDEDSPDNMDAAVWGITELLLTEDEEHEVIEEDYEPVKIGADL